VRHPNLLPFVPCPFLCRLHGFVLRTDFHLRPERGPSLAPEKMVLRNVLTVRCSRVPSVSPMIGSPFAPPDNASSLGRLQRTRVHRIYRS